MSAAGTVTCPHCGQLMNVSLAVGAVLTHRDNARNGKGAAERRGGAVALPAPARVEPAVENGKKLARARVAQVGCPEHGSQFVRPSRYGGLYCASPDPASQSGWCSWRPEEKGAA